MKKRGLIICMATLGFLCSKTALKAAAAEATPWQTYLDKAPVQAEQFAADPLGTLLRLFAEPQQAAAMARAGLAVLKANQGSLQRLLDGVQRLLPR